MHKSIVCRADSRLSNWNTLRFALWSHDGSSRHSCGSSMTGAPSCPGQPKLPCRSPATNEVVVRVRMLRAPSKSTYSNVPRGSRESGRCSLQCRSEVAAGWCNCGRTSFWTAYQVQQNLLDPLQYPQTTPTHIMSSPSKLAMACGSKSARQRPSAFRVASRRRCSAAKLRNLLAPCGDRVAGHRWYAAPSLLHSQAQPDWHPTANR